MAILYNLEKKKKKVSDQQHTKFDHIKKVQYYIWIQTI